MPNVIWRPMAGSQTRFLTCPFYEVLLEGNRGGGKTDCLLMSFARHVGRGFGEDWRGVIFRLTYPQLDDVVAKSLKWFKRIFPKATFNQSKYTWTFPDGEQLMFRYGSKQSDYDNYHGHAYPFLGFEELTNWQSSEFYEAMLTTCRSSRSDIPRMIRATTNPYGVGHTWVKERFMIGDIPQQKPWGTEGKERLYITSRLQENRVLMEADPDYIATLQDLKDTNRRAAWLDGSWDIHIGTFLENVWNEKTCVIDPFTIPTSWTVWKAMDWGYSKPYAVLWFALDPDGVIYVWREMYGCKDGEPNTGTKEDAVTVARKIREIEKWDERSGYTYRINLADPAIFSNIGTAQSIGQIFRATGVKWQPAWNAKGSRINGAAMIVQLLAEGKLKVFKTCRNFIRTVPSLPPDPYNPEDVDTSLEDHCWDCCRYGVMRKRRNPNKDDTGAFDPNDSGASFGGVDISFAPDF